MPYSSMPVRQDRDTTGVYSRSGISGTGATLHENQTISLDTDRTTGGGPTGGLSHTVAAQTQFLTNRNPMILKQNIMVKKITQK